MTRNNLITKVLESYWKFFEHLHAREVRLEALRFRATFYAGAISVILFLVLIVTGVFLMYFFEPHESQAWSSIRAMEERVRHGALLRAVHNVSGQLMLVFVIVHVISLVWRRAHERRKLANWLIGVVLLVLTVALSYTGYLLPYDQLAYWATTVGAHMAGSAPYMGHHIQSALFGGDAVTQVTLIRFYVHHCVSLPLIFAVLLSLHLYRIRKDGGLKLSTVSTDVSAWVRNRRSLLKWELWLLAFVCFAAVVVSIFYDVPLGPEAAPEITPNPMKAPWYLIALQELLHFHHPFVASYVVPLSALCLLASLPLLSERQKTLSIFDLSGSGAALLYFLFLLLCFVALWGSQSPNWTLFVASIFFLGMTAFLRRHALLGRLPYLALILCFVGVTYLALSLVALFFRGPGWRLEL